MFTSNLCCISLGGLQGNNALGLSAIEGSAFLTNLAT